LADERLDDDAIQEIAAEVRPATTGFVSKLDNGSWRDRFFTPIPEINMCGNVVVGAFTALIESGALTLWVPIVAKTHAGDIGITITSGADGPLVEMAQRRPSSVDRLFDCGALTKLLGITADDLHQTLPVGDRAMTVKHHIEDRVGGTYGSPAAAAGWQRSGVARLPIEPSPRSRRYSGCGARSGRSATANDKMPFQRRRALIFSVNSEDDGNDKGPVADLSSNHERVRSGVRK